MPWYKFYIEDKKVNVFSDLKTVFLTNKFLMRNFGLTEKEVF